MMPFLDRLQLWADERPDDTAVVVGEKRLTWADLRDAATLRLAETTATTILAAPNSLAFVVDYSAAVSGERRCAVLDPLWPQSMIDEVSERIATAFPESPGSAGDRLNGRTGDELFDGDAESTFLIGLTSGTTSVPKAFTRSRR